MCRLCIDKLEPGVAHKPDVAGQRVTITIPQPPAMDGKKRSLWNPLLGMNVSTFIKASRRSTWLTLRFDWGCAIALALSLPAMQYLNTTYGWVAVSPDPLR